MVRLDGPATALFGDFEVVAHQVTLLHYTDDLGLPRPLLRLVSVPPERRPAGASASE